MRHLFIVTAAGETPTGVFLLLLPAVVLALLFGWREIGPETALIARVAGAGVLGLGVASWLARHDGHPQAPRGLLSGLFVYNAAAVVLLVFAGAVLRMVGLLLWPAVVYHVALGAWSAVGLRGRSVAGGAALLLVVALPGYGFAQEFAGPEPSSGLDGRELAYTRDAQALRQSEAVTDKSGSRRFTPEEATESFPEPWVLTVLNFYAYYGDDFKIDARRVPAS